MTPEERRRADEINAAVTRFSKSHKPAQAVTIPGISRPEASTERRRLPYISIACTVIALHIAGYFAYAFHKQQQTHREEITRLREDVITVREEHEKKLARYIESARMAEAARTQKHEKALQQTIAQAQVPQPSRAKPQIEYNVYREPPKAAPVYSQPAYTPTQTTNTEPFSRQQHGAFGMEQAKFYFNGEYAKKLAVRSTSVTSITIDSITYDQNWNKYSTEGRVNIEYYQKDSYKTYTRSMKYEAVTHVKDGMLALETAIIAK